MLFILAPVFDLFRYDLNADHAWLLGMEWRLGLDPFLAGKASALEAAGIAMAVAVQSPSEAEELIRQGCSRQKLDDASDTTGPLIRGDDRAATDQQQEEYQIRSGQGGFGSQRAGH